MFPEEMKFASCIETAHLFDVHSETVFVATIEGEIRSCRPTQCIQNTNSKPIFNILAGKTANKTTTKEMPYLRNRIFFKTFELI